MIFSLKARIFLTMAFMLTQFSTGLYVAVLPAISNDYRVSHQAVMLTVSLFLMGFAVGQLFWGALSDHYNRKRLFIIALSLYLVESVVLSCAVNFDVYRVLFLAWGFSAAALTSIGNAMIRDVYGEKMSATVVASIGVAMSLGPIIGPFVGAHLFALVHHGKIVFMVLAAYALINLIGIGKTLVLPERTLPSQHSKKLGWHAFKALIGNGWYVFYVMSLSILYGAFFGYVTVSALLFEKYYMLSANQYGFYYLLSAASCVVGAVLNRTFMPRLGVKRLVLVGMIGVLLGSMMLLVTQMEGYVELRWVLLSVSVFMFGFGFIVPSCKAGAMMVSCASYAGLAAAIMKFMQIVGGVLFTIMVTLVHESFFSMSVLIGAAAMLMLGLMLILSLKEFKQGQGMRC